MGFFDRFFNKDKKEDLEKGLEKTKVGFFEKISKAIAGKSTIDEGVLDELEQVLISSAAFKYLSFATLALILSMILIVVSSPTSELINTCSNSSRTPYHSPEGIFPYAP